MDTRFILDFTWPDYLFGLLVFIVISCIGIWIIVIGLQGRRTFLNGLLRVPLWLMVFVGMLLRAPTFWYIHAGIKAGLFRIK